MELWIVESRTNYSENNTTEGVFLDKESADEFAASEQWLDWCEVIHWDTTTNMRIND